MKFDLETYAKLERLIVMRRIAEMGDISYNTFKNGIAQQLRRYERKERENPPDMTKYTSLLQVGGARVIQQIAEILQIPIKIDENYLTAIRIRLGEERSRITVVLDPAGDDSEGAVLAIAKIHDLDFLERTTKINREFHFEGTKHDLTMFRSSIAKLDDADITINPYAI